MVAAFFLMLQAASPLPAPPPAPADFDLATWWPARPVGLDGCPISDGGDVVICGRRTRTDDYPMEEMARLFEPKPLVAQLPLGNAVTARAYVERVDLPNGVISNRMMIGLKLPF